MQRTILVIEDNEQNLYLSTYLLEESGHHVIQARDGKTGIRMAVQQVPDLILLDIQLPEMDGYAVFRELRALPWTGGCSDCGRHGLRHGWGSRACT